MKKIFLSICFSIIATVMVYADNLTATVNHALDGASSGEIHLTITGGMAPYTIEWTGPDGFTATTSTSLVGLAAGTYHVKVTDSYCGIAEMDIIVEAKSTSIDDITPMLVQIHPNPTQGILNITFEKSGTYQLKVFNILGQQLMSQNLNQKEQVVDISRLPQGIYTLEISNENQSFIQKISKI